jgi:hypothetical protein
MARSLESYYHVGAAALPAAAYNQRQREFPRRNTTMPDKNQILRDSTYKDHGYSVRERIFYTLTAVESARAKRTAKAVALLLELLHRKRFLSDEQLDDFLYDSVT